MNCFMETILSGFWPFIGAICLLWTFFVGMVIVIVAFKGGNVQTSFVSIEQTGKASKEPDDE